MSNNHIKPHITVLRKPIYFKKWTSKIKIYLKLSTSMSIPISMRWVWFKVGENDVEESQYVILKTLHLDVVSVQEISWISKLFETMWRFETLFFVEYNMEIIITHVCYEGTRSIMALGKIYQTCFIIWTDISDK